MRDSLSAWQLRVPQLRLDWDDLQRAVRAVGRRPRVAADARRQRRVGKLPAAGMPWFMTVFGRDTLITCLQTLLFGPELARERARGARRAPGDRGRSRRSMPSPARSSTRCGAARPPRLVPRYYGTVDATPLYLDPALRGVALDGRRASRQRAEGAGAARARVDRPLRRPRRRRLRRVRAAHAARPREPVLEGLGRLAALRRRPARRAADRAGEVQGYVYDAKLRTRRDRARGLARPGARRAARARGGRSSSARSTRRSGSTTAAATTRSRSTATSSRSTRSARTSATCSGAASSRPNAPTRSSTG